MSMQGLYTALIYHPDLFAMLALFALLQMLAGKNRFPLQFLGKVASRWTGSCEDLKNIDQVKYVKNHNEDPKKQIHTQREESIRAYASLLNLVQVRETEFKIEICYIDFTIPSYTVIINYLLSVNTARNARINLMT